ncbi:MAG: glycoside hydrolase family 57 protein, partial [Leptospirillum sp.]
MKGRILLLWHMHQPAYWDPVMKNIGLPWVRLHGVRGYNDLPFMARLFPHIRQTINLVPSLLDQIEHVAGGGVQDAYQILTMKPPEDLTPPDRDYLLRNFFSCPFDSMIRPNHQYVNIWQKVQSAISGKPPETQLPPDVLTNREILDLQVLFNLVWFGYGARHEHPEIEEWLRKGSGFTEEDKAGVMDLQLSVLKNLIPSYRELAESGQIEISASPYYHPILPLLISSSIGSRPRPGITLPEEFSWPNDAREQVLMALDRHESLLGIRPRGMWPSEGSVCPELMDILASAGLDWTATDQGILDESIGGSGNMTHPWHVTTGHGDIRIIFRQRALSDRIGFLYSRYNGTEAAKDLLAGIEATGGGLSGSHPPIIPIILDGENPWESYPDGGYLFLRSFFERLDTHP